MFIAQRLTVKFPVCSKLCTGFFTVEVVPSPKSQSHSSATSVKSENCRDWKAQAVVWTTLKFVTGLVPTRTAEGMVKVSVQPVLVVIVSVTV